MEYVKKPIKVQAVQWNGDNFNEVMEFMKDTDKGLMQSHNSEIKLLFMNGYMTARKGDYIIKTHKGEIYPCRADNFEEIYGKPR